MEISRALDYTRAMALRRKYCLLNSLHYTREKEIGIIHERDVALVKREGRRDGIMHGRKRDGDLFKRERWMEEKKLMRNILVKPRTSAW